MLEVPSRPQILVDEMEATACLLRSGIKKPWHRVVNKEKCHNTNSPHQNLLDEHLAVILFLLEGGIDTDVEEGE